MSIFIDLSLLKRNRNFCLLFIGQFVSFIGTMITFVALPYQIYQETHSTLLVGLLGSVQLLPLLVTALLGGVLADRYQRKKLLIGSELLLAVGCLALFLNTLTVMPNLWLIFIIAAAMSALTGIQRPALESITQQLVSAQDFIVVGTLKNFRMSVGLIAAPAAGGLIIAHFGIALTFFVDMLTFIISLLALLLMSHIPKPEAKHHESAWISLKGGCRYALSRQELMGSYLVDFVAMIFGMPMALYPAIANSFGGAKTLGLLYSAPAVGALFLSLFSGWFKKIRRHGVAIAVSAGLWGITIIFFGLANNLWLALFFLVLSGALDAASGIFRDTLWNATIPNSLRGRLAGIEMLSYLSGPKLGDTEAGLVAAAFGVTTSIVSGGILCVIGVAVCCYAFPKFWRYRAEQ